ncbi:cell filamentation protein Fic [Rhodococcus ruber]|uniref:Fic/DOC family protein n=1 Tax=Rhodococcus TaxID=1827 RepID=UPI00029A95B3|nr:MULTISPECIES: Fic/DOC family protein [Rhodococcus]ATQ30233.1 cell filamentation protein Fic [Rhodococcus ruber]
MTPTAPWNTGDHERDWDGYFIPGTQVLRNRVGASTVQQLHDAETDLSEVRLLELREKPGLVAPRSYDLSHLSAIHRHLFQDVYEWAGSLRTVGTEKWGESFCPPANIQQAMHHVAMEIADSKQLRTVPRDKLPKRIAYLYDYVNYAHPFREGNGRTTREFFDQLLAEQSLGLDWSLTASEELYQACHAARANSDLSGLVDMFTRILDDCPAYNF